MATVQKASRFAFASQNEAPATAAIDVPAPPGRAANKPRLRTRRDAFYLDATETSLAAAPPSPPKPVCLPQPPRCAGAPRQPGAADVLAEIRLSQEIKDLKQAEVRLKLAACTRMTKALLQRTDVLGMQAFDLLADSYALLNRAQAMLDQERPVEDAVVFWATPEPSPKSYF